ncbi:MAG: hypothetical protein WC985_10855 [Thermoplasmata archaeon]
MARFPEAERRLLNKKICMRFLAAGESAWFQVLGPLAVGTS